MLWKGMSGGRDGDGGADGGNGRGKMGRHVLRCARRLDGSLPGWRTPVVLSLL
jgi:hypothetical protein